MINLYVKHMCHCTLYLFYMRICIFLQSIGYSVTEVCKDKLQLDDWKALIAAQSSGKKRDIIELLLTIGHRPAQS